MLLVACCSIWRVFPQEPSSGEGGGEGQERLVAYPGDLSVPWGARHLSGPRCGWHQTAVCHAASPAGWAWQRAASFLSAAFTAAYVKRLMTSFPGAVRDPSPSQGASVTSTIRWSIQVSKGGHAQQRFQVLANKRPPFIITSGRFFCPTLFQQSFPFPRKQR